MKVPIWNSSPFSELYPFVLALIAAGIVAGFLAGLFGIGGGAVLVPVFYQMLGALGFDEAIKMHVAVGTSLAIIVPTSLQSFRKHKARGAVDMELLRSFVISVPFGVVCASLVTAYISGAGLRGIFACVALVIALRLLLARENWKLGNDIPTGWIRNVTGWIIGFFSTFMGIGGGVMNNTFMTLFGRPMHQAVATSAGNRGADLDTWCHRLYLGRMGCNRPAAVFHRLCKPPDLCNDDTDHALHGTFGGQGRAFAVQTPFGNGVRDFPNDRLDPVFHQHSLGAAHRAAIASKSGGRRESRNSKVFPDSSFRAGWLKDCPPGRP